MRLLTAFLLLIPGLAFAQVNLISEVFKIVAVTHDNGTVSEQWQAAEKIVPGDKVGYRIRYQNEGEQAATGIVINNPIPQNTVYLANTGQWLMLNQDGNIQRMRWARKMTPPTINPGDYLLFPSQDAQPVDAQMGSQIKRLWLIDGTWQQANKMLRQSSWLQQLPSLQLSEYDSQFSLRRNQQGLCTMESAIAACAAANCDFDSSAAQFNFQLLQNACLTISSS